MARGAGAEAARREETVYRCPTVSDRGQRCDAVLVISDLDHGVLRAILCKRCNRRQTIYLGGRRVAPDRAPAPPLPAGELPGAPAIPPIETRRIGDGRG